MHYKKSNDMFPFSDNRFETTYGNSYNKMYNYTNRLNANKMDENRSATNPKLNPNISLPNPKPIYKTSSFNPVKTVHQESVDSFRPPKEDNIQPNQLKTVDYTQFDYNHMVTQIAKITDNIYLSSLHAITVDRLKQLGISLVVSLIAETSVMRLPSTIERLQVNIEDTENVNIRRHFDKVLDRMNLEERRQGRILVHCVAGISRSTTIILAYLMRYHSMRLKEAYNLVHSHRPYVQPNLGFWRQLIEYERSIFGSVTVNMVPMEGGGRVLVPDVRPSILSQILSATALRHSRSSHMSAFTSF